MNLAFALNTYNQTKASSRQISKMVMKQLNMRWIRLLEVWKNLTVV